MVRLLIKAIIFDYYGVMCPRIVPCLAENTAKQFGSDYSTVRNIMEPLLYALDENSITFYEYWKILKSKLKNNIPKLKDHMKIWEQCSLQLDLRTEMKDLVLTLKKTGYKVPLLTNITKTMVKFNKMKGRYRIFKPVFLSCDIGLKKPSPVIFLYALKKLKLKPEECIFVDDQQSYLDGAEKVGIKTILFKDYLQLVEDLKRFGVNGI